MRTADQRCAESCCGFWWRRMSSVTDRSPSERAARVALARPSSSSSWQWMSVTSLRCMGRDSCCRDVCRRYAASFSVEATDAVYCERERSGVAVARSGGERKGVRSAPGSSSSTSAVLMGSCARFRRIGACRRRMYKNANRKSVQNFFKQNRMHLVFRWWSDMSIC